MFIVMLHPDTQLGLRDAVPLDEEQFGLADQRRARVGSEETSDPVQMETGGVGVCAKEMTAGAAANDAADEAIAFPVLSPSERVAESGEGFLHPQPFVQDYVEMKRLKRMSQHL